MDKLQIEIKALKTTSWSLVGIATALAILVVFTFAKRPEFEYRQPIATIVTKSLNTAYLLSASRDAMVSYSIQISSTLSLSGGQSGTIALQTSPDNITYTTVATQTNNNLGALTLGLNTQQVQATSLTCFVPKTYYVKLTTSGASTFTWQSGMEVLL